MGIAKESVEVRITRYIKEVLGHKDSEVALMRLPEKLSLVEMNDKNKWNEFKVGLRESGYII
jgi:hypothetical protein